MYDKKHIIWVLTPKSWVRVTLISMVSMILGHLMVNTYVPNEGLNLVGLLIVSVFVYYFTLYKKDIFSFVMVIYFCSNFPFLSAKGGAFNLVTFVCAILFIISEKQFPSEKKNNDVIYYFFIFLLALSTVLGWLFNYAGTQIEFLYSFFTFCGVLIMLIISSKLEITPERIKFFLQINFILIIYATIASLNKYLQIIPFNTPMLPIYGTVGSYFEGKGFEGGGLLGSSPLYGEHSMILFTLFMVFLIVSKIKLLNQSTLLIAAIISMINIFMSISRSVFLLSIVGLFLIIIFQFKVNPINLITQFRQSLIVFLLGVSIFLVIDIADLDYVLNRMEQIEKKNTKAGGISIERILDGRAFNREEAFRLARERYNSKESWLIGYGWGIEKNNRIAFYIDPTIKRGSAHSQIYAVLFLLGWIGTIAYWGVILYTIFKTYFILSKRNTNYLTRVLSFFFMISLALFCFNQIKADSISYPGYFLVTIIWLGLANSTTYKNNMINNNFIKYREKL